MSDEAEVGKVVDEMYAMISGPAGPRDWSRQTALFHEASRQVRTWIEDGRMTMRMMGRDEYAADTAPFFEANPFYEIETARRINVFGNIAHVWSIYEAKRDPGSDELDRRGVNSIQLLKEADGRWRIIHMIWDNERPGVTAAL